MTRFDEAVKSAIDVLQANIEKPLQSCHLVRDTTGVLVVVLPDSQLPEGSWTPLATKLNDALGAYSPGVQRVLLSESDLVDASEVIGASDRIRTDLPNVWIVDRMLTNQDWVRPPIRSAARIPTVVAYSVKGGVGRSTCLAMGAWHLAKLGRDVMVIDLDLEAPGIGSMLLSDLPDVGLVDWLVEEMNGQGDADLLQRCIKDSELASGEVGRVRVLAAYGSDTKTYIAKLGRVYAPTIDKVGNVIGLAERLDQLLALIAGLAEPPEAVLIDARAGIHDIGSAAVTRLGAEVFLFARNDKQDWWAYEQIFEHLRTSGAVARGMGDETDLRWKLKMVAAQTLPSEDSRRAWIESSYSTWTTFYDDEQSDYAADFQPQVFALGDQEAPHYPLFVNFDLGVRSLSLKDVNAKPEWDYVRGVFNDFFEGLEGRLWPAEIGSQGKPTV